MVLLGAGIISSEYTQFWQAGRFGPHSFSKPYRADDRIGIDTGAVYGGRLTALLLPEWEITGVPGAAVYPDAVAW